MGLARMWDTAEYFVPVVTLLCLVGAALTGAVVNVRLPRRHVAEDTVQVVRFAANIFVVITSVVLALMLNSAKATYETNQHNLHAMTTEVIMLDRSMRSLGPEGDEVRRRLADYVRMALNERNILDEDRQAEDALNAVGASLRAITVSDDQKLAIWTDARQVYRQVVRDRWIALDAAGGTIPTPMIVIMVGWLVVIFAATAVGAPRNPVVATTFVATAVLLSSVLYLIMELDRPVSGLIPITNAPFQRALSELEAVR